ARTREPTFHVRPERRSQSLRRKKGAWVCALTATADSCPLPSARPRTGRRSVHRSSTLVFARASSTSSPHDSGGVRVAPTYTQIGRPVPTQRRRGSLRPRTSFVRRNTVVRGLSSTEPTMKHPTNTWGAIALFALFLVCACSGMPDSGGDGA